MSPFLRLPPASRRFLPFLSAFIAAGCASPHRIEALKDPRAEGYVVLDGVRLEAGAKAYDCGPEAVTAILRAAGDRDLTVEQATARLYDEARKGTLSVDLVPFIRERGFRPELVSGANLATLKELIRSRRPALAMLNVASFPRKVLEAYRPQGLHHFFVVTGFNDRREEVVCEWYGGKKALVAYREFAPAWADDGNFCLVIGRETPESLTQAGREFLARGSAPQARASWERALALDPGWVPARLQLGALAFREGRADDAVAEFGKAVGLEPLNPEALNDLAFARSARGESGDEVAGLARRAVERYAESAARAEASLAAQRATLGAEARIAAERDLARLKADLASAHDTEAGILEARGAAAEAVAASEAALAPADESRAEFRARQFLRIARMSLKTGDAERARTALIGAEKAARTQAQWEEIARLKENLRSSKFQVPGSK